MEAEEQALDALSAFAPAPLYLIVWTERDGRHLSRCTRGQAINVLTMILTDPTMALVTVAGAK
jgi:hypothetical protein